MGCVERSRAYGCRWRCESDTLQTRRCNFDKLNQKVLRWNGAALAVRCSFAVVCRAVRAASATAPRSSHGLRMISRLRSMLLSIPASWTTATGKWTFTVTPRSNSLDRPWAHQTAAFHSPSVARTSFERKMVQLVSQNRPANNIVKQIAYATETLLHNCSSCNFKMPLVIC